MKGVTAVPRWMSMVSSRWLWRIECGAVTEGGGELRRGLIAIM
jgi:hypothetical protein